MNSTCISSWSTFLFIARDLTYHLVHVNTPPLSHTLVLSVNAVSLLVSELICVIQDLGISTWHLFSLPMTIVMEILSILQHSQILPLWEGEEKSHTPTFIVCSRLLNKLTFCSDFSQALLCPVQQLLSSYHHLHDNSLGAEQKECQILYVL